MGWKFLDEADAKMRVDGLLSIIKEYHWIINAYIVEFFSADHWKSLPQEWQTFFEALTPQECYEFIGLVADFSAMRIFLQRSNVHA
jgi:hypothetical protein